MQKLSKKLKAVLSNLKNLFLTVIILIVVIPLVLGILWLTPLLIVILAGTIIFLALKLLSTKIDDEDRGSE